MKRNIVVSLLLVLLMLFVVSCEEPKHEHTLEKVEAVAATCSEEGMKEYYQCSVCKMTFADKEAKTEVKDLATLKTDKDPANHTGVKKVEAVESTCTVNGTVAHWHCEGCGKNYSDETCKSELKTLEASLKAHETEMVKAVAATCSEEGMKEYYQCSVCEHTFADKEATEEVKELASLKTEKDPANHSKVNKVDAVESTCTVKGIVPHWHCEGCGKNYNEEICEIELESLEAPLKAHKTVLVNAVAATCASEGMKEYYKCSVCEKTFKDAEATKEITNLDILKTEKDPANHSKVDKVEAIESTCAVKGNIEHWHCEGCGKNYNEEECALELDNVKTSLKPHDLGKVEAVAVSCEKEGNVEHYHCSVCGDNFSDAEGNGKIVTVVIPRHKEGDVIATGETFTVGEVEYSIYKCNHDNHFIDEACTEKLYKDYFDAAGLVVTEKDGVLDAYFSDCDVFMSTEAASSYGYQKAIAYFADKKFARLGYNNNDVGGMDATENKALTLTVTKDEDGNIQITGESQGDKKPLTGITSITLNEAKTELVMVANGGETWNLKQHSNPVRGTYKDSAGNTITFGRYVMKYSYSGEEAFYVADIDETHIKVLSNNSNSGDHGNTTFGFRHYLKDFEKGILYVKWDTNLVDEGGNRLATLNNFYIYNPVVE